MKSIYLSRTVVAGLGVVASMLVLQAQSQPERQQAKASFESVCAACHGLDGRGSERGPDVSSRPEIVGKSDGDLLNVVKEGRPGKGMPAFSSYGEKQLVALVAYIRELQGAGKPMSMSGDPLRGRRLFFGKAGCSQCHMIAGQGGFFAAELTGFAAKKSHDEVRSTIVSPGKDRDPRKGPVTVKLADATVLTGLPRNEDNFSIQLQTPDGSFHLLKKAEIVSLSRSKNSAITGEHGRGLAANELNDLAGYLMQSAASQAAGKPLASADEGDEE